MHGTDRETASATKRRIIIIFLVWWAILLAEAPSGLRPVLVDTPEESITVAEYQEVDVSNWRNQIILNGETVGNVQHWTDSRSQYSTDATQYVYTDCKH